MNVESFSSSLNLDSFICGGEKGPIMNPSTPLGDYVRTWLTTFKQNTIKSASYDRLVTSADALDNYAIAKQPIQDITFFDIQNYINELVSDGYALTTIKKQTRIVTAPLKQAAAMRVCAGAEGFEPSTKVLETYTKHGHRI